MVVLAGAGCARGTAGDGMPPAPVTVEQVSGVRTVLQAVSAVNERVVWVSGHGGVVLRTLDGGTTWERLRVDADSGLQYRDVHAVSADVAWVLAAGPGDRSRIYRTADGGRSWALQFTNTNPDAFFDCLDFWDPTHGVVVSDAVNGRMLVMTTDDGVTWAPVPDAGVPAALTGEGAFAASGTCLVARPGGRAWIGTGATDGARVYRSTDRGRSWAMTAVPVVSGSAAGVASVAFRDDRHGMALGGRIAVPTDTANQVAVTSDGGATWTRAGRPTFPGAVFGSAWVPGRRVPVLVAVGPGGMSVTADDGATWAAVNANAYWAVGIASPRAGWAVGPGGRITRFSVP